MATPAVGLEGRNWPTLQIELESSGELDRNTAAVAAKLGVSLTAKSAKENETFRHYYPAEILALRMLEIGHIGYMCHLVAEPERCLYESIKARDPVLVKYYVERRAPISIRIWKEMMKWGSRSVYTYILKHSPVDYLTECEGMVSDTEFAEHLIETYQLSSRVQYLNWLLRLIGGAFSIAQIEAMELPMIQRKECLKGMHPTTMREAMERWKILLDPYLAGLSGDPKTYYQFLPTELWTVTMISVEPEKVPISDGIFYATETKNGMEVKMPLQRGINPAVDARRALYNDNALRVFTGICDRIQQVPKEAAGMIASYAQHFPHHEDNRETGFHPVSWYRQTIENGRRHELKSPRDRRDPDSGGYNYDYARNIVFSTALKESCIEALQELHRDGPIEYRELLFRARTGQIADWCFQLMVKDRVTVTLMGIDLDTHDPYYPEVVAVHRKWYPNAPYLPAVSEKR